MKKILIALAFLFAPDVWAGSPCIWGPGSTATCISTSVKSPGVIESTSGGFKFPDATTQTTAATSSSASIGGTLTGGTVGSVLFSGSAVFAQDNSNLFWDDTGNRLGVGLSGVAPAFILDVQSSINDNTPLFRVRNFNGVEVMRANSNTQLSFTGGSVNGSSDFFTIIPGSHTNVGSNAKSFTVSANTPSINGSYAAQQFSLLEQPAVTSGGANTVTDAATLAVTGAPKAAGSALITNSSGLRVSSAATVTTGVTNAYGVYVDAPTGATNNYAAIFQGGNVGIGTTAPAEKLNVVGGAIFDGESGIAVQAFSSGTAAALQIEGQTTGFALEVVGGGVTIAPAANAGLGGNVPFEQVLRNDTSAGSASCSITCEAGEILTGGGCQNSGAFTVRDSSPSSGTTWNCVYNSAAGDCTAHAVCFLY